MKEKEIKKEDVAGFNKLRKHCAESIRDAIKKSYKEPEDKIDFIAGHVVNIFNKLSISIIKEGNRKR